MIKIVVDTLGSDSGYKDALDGSLKALKEIDDLSLVLVGKKEVLESDLENDDYDKERIEILDSKEVITNYDHPVEAIKTKKESSLVIALNYLASHEGAQGLVNASSTGALLVGSTLILGRINKLRPAMATFLPNEKGELTLLTDCGANIDPSPQMVYSFGLIGKALFEAYTGKENPKIAILSNGAEEGKGNQLTKDSYALLKADSNLNFIGNTEGTYALNGEADVIVSDGFSGNIFLKSVEGSAKIVIKEAFKHSKEIGMSLIKRFDFTSLGGAILAGVNKVVVKGHGSANKDTWYNCIKMNYKISKGNLVEKIKQNL
ncbi:MAG: phosphate acyltransferase PlsX [Gammaproteobacteria bacterium]|nr:phosphate acyltransferase PlsX [Gammaproteobacteria bacterium]